MKNFPNHREKERVAGGGRRGSQRERGGREKGGWRERDIFFKMTKLPFTLNSKLDGMGKDL